MKTLVGKFLFGLFLLAMPTASLALDPAPKAEFDRIGSLTMTQLTQETAGLLEKKYPGEDWERYQFPSFVFSEESVELGYKIAVKEPELLGNPGIAATDPGIPCYCFCDAMGHKNLLYCFWRDGKAGGEFDDHAADCRICIRQAMLAFLWRNLGASDDEILKGMEEKFQPLRSFPRKP